MEPNSSREPLKKDFLTDCKGLAKIGQGAFGQVYYYKTAPDQIPVIEYAIKKISLKSLKYSSDERLCRQEIDILDHLRDHEHIVRIHGSYEDPGKYLYIVLEYVAGGPLLKQLEKNKIYTENGAQKIMKTLTSTVQYIHSKNIVHRDLKIENILLTSSGIVKIADFGLAGYLDEQQLLSGHVGTTVYMAPEILFNQRYGKEVDLWALGVICYILLSGTYPFAGKQLEDNIKKGKYELKTNIWYNVSAEGKDFVRKLLIVKPKGRMTVEKAFNDDWFKKDLTDRKILLAFTVFRLARRWKEVTQRRVLERRVTEEKIEQEQEQEITYLDEIALENLERQRTISALTTTSDIHEGDSPSSPPHSHPNDPISPVLSTVIEEERETLSSIQKPELIPSLEKIKRVDTVGADDELRDDESLVPIQSLSASNQLSQSFLYEFYKPTRISYYWEFVLGVNLTTGEEVSANVYDLNQIPSNRFALILNEASILASLSISSQNCLQKFHNIIYRENKCYVIQERLYGKDLLARISEMKQNDYSEDVVKAWMVQLFHAIHDLHQGNIVHGNIRPESIAFTSDGYDADLKLIDFKYSRTIKQKKCHTSYDEHGLSSYTSPEEIEDDEIRAKANDMWSLGILLYFLFVGRTPFQQVPLKELKEKINNFSLQLSSDPGFGFISEHGKDLIQKLLCRNPNQRISIQDAVTHSWFMNVSKPELIKRISHEIGTNNPQNVENSALSHIRRLYTCKKLRRGFRAIAFIIRVVACLKEKAHLQKLSLNRHVNETTSEITTPESITPPPPADTSIPGNESSTPGATTLSQKFFSFFFRRTFLRKQEV